MNDKPRYVTSIPLSPDGQMVCDYCEYSATVEIQTGKRVFASMECRYNPPTADKFPLVTKLTWCGEFKKREHGRSIEWMEVR